MSQINKKEKILTTKRINKKSDKRGKRSQQDFGINSPIFDSFVNSRNSKQQKDDSLLNAHSSDSPTAEENDTGFFIFASNAGSCLVENKKFSETTIIPPQKSIFEEETKIGISINDSCFKSKLDNTFNDSSLFFESNTKQAFKSEDNSSPVVIDSNNCKISKEDNTKDIILDDGVPIPDVPDIEKLKPSTITGENLKEDEDSDFDARNQCPVCLRTVAAAKYLSHIKCCAAKNKLSTQQLLSALRLHKKQLAERQELGLGIPAQCYKARVSPRRSRTNERKGPLDSSLQLALALSASLHTAQEDEVIQEAEALKEAGLCDEAEQKLSTLEKYGFALALPLQPRTTAGGSKTRTLLPSLLLKRNQEERERIVTEKVAIILISEEENVNLIPFTLREPELKSKGLKEKWDN